MTPVYIILAAILGLGLGAIVLLTGIFFWYLLKTMKEVQRCVGEFVRVMDPLVKTGALQQLSTSAAGILKTARDVSALLPDLNATFKAFNQAFFKKQESEQAFEEAPTESFARTGESLRVSYSEEEAAAHETSDNLRRQGIETDATRVIEPQSSKMTGSSV